MIKFRTWIQGRLGTKRRFQDHFQINHQFHGIKHHQISESYIIQPKSELAIQLFYEGVQFPFIDLNLQCKIERNQEEIQVHLSVHDPHIAKEILAQIQFILSDQISLFQKQLFTNPKLNYVQTFCKDCSRKNSKPFTLCIRSCEYQTKN